MAHHTSTLTRFRTSPTRRVRTARGRTALWAVTTALVLLVAASCTSHPGNALVPAARTAALSSRPPAAVADSPSAGRPTTTVATSAAPPQPPARTPHTIWSSRSPLPLGQPVAVGKDSIVLYVSINTVPHIQVMAAATGVVRWRQPASIGAEISGKVVVPAVVNNKVIYVRPDDNSLPRGHLVMADPVTGRDLSVGKDDLWTTERPHECDSKVCFAGSVPDGREQSFIAEVPSGRTKVDAARRTPDADDLHLAGVMLIRPVDRPELLVRRVAGRTRWQHSILDLFGPDYGSQGGWRIDQVMESDLVVAQLGRHTGHQETSVDLATTEQTIGLSLKGGMRLWTGRGTDRMCLPAATYFGDGHALDTLRCRWGAGSTMKISGAVRTLHHASVSLEGFDPANGRTTWSVPLAATDGTTYENWVASLRMAGEHALVAPGRGGTVVIDPATGTVRSGDQAQQGICEHWITGPVWDGGWTRDDLSYNRYATGISYTSCDLHGNAAAPGSAWPSWAGVDIAGMHVVTTPQGLVASKMLPGPDPAAVSAAPTSQPGGSAPGRSGGAGTPAPVAAGPPALAWTAGGADVPLTQPVAAGKVVVLYLRSAGALTLAGVDPATGRTIWRRPASAGTFGAFTDIKPTVIGRRVLYPRPEPGSDSHGVVMVLADAATGRDLHVGSGAYWLRDWPRVCGHDACFTAYNSQGMYALRMDMNTGFIAQDPPMDSAQQAPVGPDLVQVRSADAGHPAVLSIAAMDTALVRFQVPAASLIPAGYVAYTGAFQLWRSAGSYVGEFAQDLAPGTPSTHRVGAKAPMVGIDAATGRKLWSTTGTDTSCLPWQMRSAPVYPVRCRWSKTAEEVYEGGRWVYRNADRAMEGFDPKTGATTWAVPLAHLAGEVVVTGVVAGDHWVLAPGPTGEILIDLSKGTSKPAAGRQRRFCATGVNSPLGLTRTINGIDQPDLWGTGTAWDQCTAAGQPTTTTAAWPSWVGALVGGVRVVLTSNGLQGYRPG